MTKEKKLNTGSSRASGYRTKKLVLLALISALAYISVVFCRLPIIPAVPFIDLEFKSAIILIGAFIFGPMSGFVMSVVVSFVELLTVSSTGFIGCIMNILATACLVCPAAFVYKKKKTTLSAIIGLIIGTLLLTIAMVLWNYLVTPFYMGVPRDAIVSLLLPAFVPFNLLKGAINSAVAMLLYKFVLAALEKANLIPKEADRAKNSIGQIAGVVILSVLVILTSVLIILAFNGIF